MCKGACRVSLTIARLAIVLIAMPTFAVAKLTDEGIPATAKSAPLLSFAAHVEMSRLRGGPTRLYQTSIPVSEYRAFSGIGAIVCSSGHERRSATAFLVGGFDIAVTVAHAFEIDSRMAQPHECEYLVAGPLGRIRERIAVARIHSQWRAQPELFGRPDCDLAVIRLSTPARLPQMTLSLTRFAYTGAPISLIGFSPELATDPQQRRLRGRVYVRPRSSCVKFSHDIEPRLVSSGAPLIDRRDGVVIGIHSYLRQPVTNARGSCKDRGNAMLLMNDWLEKTLRTEIAASSPPGTHEPAP